MKTIKDANRYKRIKFLKRTMTKEEDGPPFYSFSCSMHRLHLYKEYSFVDFLLFEVLTQKLKSFPLKKIK